MGDNHMPDKDYIVWFAGFFDGEGHISYQRHCVTSCRIGVSQSGNIGEKVCKEISEKWGCGSLKSYVPSNPNQKINWQWGAWNATDVRFVLEAITPYLRIKKQKAQETLEAISLPHQHRWTKTEDDILKSNYANTDIINLSLMVNHLPEGVRVRAANLKLKQGKRKAQRSSCHAAKLWRAKYRRNNLEKVRECQKVSKQKCRNRELKHLEQAIQMHSELNDAEILEERR